MLIVKIIIFTPLLPRMAFAGVTSSVRLIKKVSYLKPCAPQSLRPLPLNNRKTTALKQQLP